MGKMVLVELHELYMLFVIQQERIKERKKMKKFINSLLVLSFVFAYPFTIYAADEIEEETISEGANEETKEAENNETTNNEITEPTRTAKSEQTTSDEVKENSESGSSRWKTDQPEKLTTSEGIIVEFKDTDNWHLDYNDWEYKGINVTITIPEDYEEESIVLAPEVFEKIAEILQDNPEMYVEPGDKFVFDITINNLSKYTYNYEEGSFVVMPKEDIVYTKFSNQEKNGGNNETYNGKTINENYHIFRYYNTALKELLPGKNYRTITDAAINAVDPI